MSSLALADVIIDKTHFTRIGAVGNFRWAPARYETDFRYDIFYYIPKSVEKKSNVPALIFKHGGGASTMDRAGSIAAVNLYLRDLVRLADELGIIVVLPSANGLNWAGHTRGAIKDLAALMRTELDLDDNRIGLSGHSMGGMGITRTYSWLADEFSFFLPMAAGMDEKGQTEQYLSKVFNVPYVHLQGLKDHFKEFVTRTKEQEKRTKALEEIYGVPSKFEAIFYNGNHNYNYALFKTSLQRLLKAPRDLYQKELWGTFDITNRKVVDNKITFHLNSEERYFWVELAELDDKVNDRLSFHAKIEGNTINIDMPVMPKSAKSLNVYLHSQMVDLTKEVEVVLNGKLVLTHKPTIGVLRSMDARDPGFMFEDMLSVKL